MSDKKSHADEKQSSHSKEETYEKLGDAGKKGTDFQINSLITVLLNSSIKNENWRLSTENKAAGIFDDVVIELLPSLAAVMIQAKHKETKNINYRDLISDSRQSDFSLPKYFLSYQKIKYTFAIRNVIICTNTSISKNVNSVAEKRTLSTESQSKAFFCEIRSNMYCDTLKTYDISFKLPLEEPNKRVLLIYPEQEYILNVIKVHQALQNGDMSKVLFLSLDEQIDVQKQFIDGFEVPHYTYLIIICPKITDNLIREMQEKLACILSSTNYKKVILIAEEENELVKEIKHVKKIFEMKEKIGYSSLVQNSQKNFRELKCITFQGNNICLDELLPNSGDEELNDIINPEILVKFATKKKIKVGLEVNHLEEDINCYYIQRKFKRGDEKFPEKALYQYYENNDENIVLISDVPGMGKSTVLTNLAASLKSNNSNLWIVRVDINNYTDALLRFQKKNLKSITIEELLNSKEKTRLSSKLEKKVCSLSKMVVLMIDGIDEVSPTYKDVVLNMLMDCKERPNFALIFITTRPHLCLCKELEQKLQVKSWSMESFSDIDQIVFLKKFWLKKLNLKGDLEKKCQVYAEALIAEMFRWCEYTFAGIPLQARMLAEVFQEDGNDQEEENETKKWETCKEFLISTNNKPNLPNKFNLVELYEMFIDKKYNEFNNRYKEKQLRWRKIFKECERYLEILALKIIVGEENCKLFDCYKIEGKENIDEGFPLKLGIIQKVDGMIHFIHRTFAEYFVGKCLVKQLKRGNNSEQFYIFFVIEVLLSYQFNIIRLFLNGFLQTEAHLLPDNIYKDTAKQLTLLRNKLVVLICAEEGSVEILRLLFKCCHAANIDVSMSINSARIEPTLVIHKATAGNHLDIICLLIENGAIINDRDEGGHTALYAAVLQGNLDIIKCLVKNGIEINSRNNDGITALYIACTINELGIVEYLTENGADVNIGTKDGDTALHKSAAFSDLDRVKFLIGKGAEVNSSSNDGRTPLHAASKRGKLDIVEYLVENGAEVGSKSKDDITPLHEAAANGKLDVVKYLVERGAQVKGTAEDGSTALHGAANLETIKYLINNGAEVKSKNKYGYTVLHIAAAGGELDAVKYLLENGAVINNTAEDGRTALHEAVLMGHVDIVKFLVENGAQTDSIQLASPTPLYEAVTGGHFNIVQYLVENGAQVNNRAKNGCTAIHAAAATRSLNTVKYLVENDAEVNNEDVNGRTALHKAAATSELDIIECLMHTGSDVNSRTENRHTALFEAASRYNVNRVNFLVENGAEIDSRSEDDCDLDIVRYLVENGASVNIKDKDGYTALDLAAATDNWDVVTYLVKKMQNSKKTEN